MNKIDKFGKRLKRAKKTRSKIKQLAAVRLSIYRSNSHIYAQVIDASTIITQASTLSKEIKDNLKNGSNVDAAKEVGKLLAKKAIDKGIKKVAFDRSGFKYHGRVKALAEAAREAGLEI